MKNGGISTFVYANEQTPQDVPTGEASSQRRFPNSQERRALLSFVFSTFRNAFCTLTGV
jgi:hypothetical protein